MPSMARPEATHTCFFETTVLRRPIQTPTAASPNGGIGLSPTSAQTGAFVAIDLDNQLGGRFDSAVPYPPARMRRLLAEIERSTNMPITSGYAAMNDRTAVLIGTETLKLLSAKGIEVETVRPQPEEADKFLFFALGRVINKQFPCLVVVSADRGFVEAVLKLRDYDRASDLYIAVDRVEASLREHYRRVEGVKFIELRPRRERGAVMEPVGAPEYRGIDYILVCGNCGRRCKQSSAATGDLCPCCGSLLRTDAESRLVLPAGRLPYTDGPVVEIWFRGMHRRTAVLHEAYTAFVREANPKASYVQVPLGDLVDNKSQISRLQFVISDQGGGQYFLLRPLKSDKTEPREMFLGEEADLVPAAREIELTDGQIFWVNDRKAKGAEQAGAVLKCVFRRDRHSLAKQAKD